MICTIVSSGQSSIDFTMWCAYLAENFWHSKAPLIEEFKLQSNTAMRWWCIVYICSLLCKLYQSMQTCENMFLLWVIRTHNLASMCLVTKVVITIHSEHTHSLIPQPTRPVSSQSANLSTFIILLAISQTFLNQNNIPETC